MVRNTIKAFAVFAVSAAGTMIVTANEALADTANVLGGAGPILGSISQSGSNSQNIVNGIVSSASSSTASNPLSGVVNQAVGSLQNSPVTKSVVTATHGITDTMTGKLAGATGNSGSTSGSGDSGGGTPGGGGSVNWGGSGSVSTPLGGGSVSLGGSGSVNLSGGLPPVGTSTGGGTTGGTSGGGSTPVVPVTTSIGSTPSSIPIALSDVLPQTATNDPLYIALGVLASAAGGVWWWKSRRPVSR